MLSRLAGEGCVGCAQRRDLAFGAGRVALTSEVKCDSEVVKLCGLFLAFTSTYVHTCTG